MPSQPAAAPLPDHVNADLQFPADLLIVPALTGGQDDARPKRNLLGGAVGVAQLLQSLLFGGAQVDNGRFGTLHLAASAGDKMDPSYRVATPPS